MLRRRRGRGQRSAHAVPAAARAPADLYRWQGRTRAPPRGALRRRLGADGQRSRELRAPIAELRRLFADAGKPEPEIVAAGRLPLEDDGAVRDRLAELAGIGVTRFALGVPYSSADEFRAIVEQLLRAKG